LAAWNWFWKTLEGRFRPYLLFTVDLRTASIFIIMADTNVFCSQCGTANLNTARFCQKCGATVALLGAGTAMTPAPPAGAFMAPPAAMPAPAMIVQPYGGFWIRVLAMFIDSAVLGVVTVPITILLAGASMASIASMGDNPDPARVFALIFSLFAIFLPLIVGLGWLYEALTTSGSWQATLGKHIVGLKVTDLAGNRISFGRATGRHFAKILSNMCLYIGFIMVAFTERKQGLHDMIAGTLVMKK
jgi:uncharacterized RDD family membrane protein YckC